MKRFTKIALPIVAALVAAGQLNAQPAEPAKTASTQLSSDQMRQRGVELTEQVRLDTQRVQHLQSLARKEKDVIKLSCVNDKFVKLKAETNIFDSAHSELIAALDTNERFGAFPKMTVAADNAHKVREEADGCISADELKTESSQSEYTSPEITDDPTTGLPFEIKIEPPAYASPFS